jgi:hypothetical protein
MGAQARALVAGTMLAALLAVAPAARAGTYEVTACDSDDEFAWTSWAKTTARNTAGDNIGVALASCPTGEQITGGIYVTTQYHPGDFSFARARSAFASARLAPGGGYAAWTFTAPAGTSVAAVEATASCRIPSGIVAGGFASSSPGVLTGTCPPDRFDTVTYTPGAGSTFARISVSCIAVSYTCGQNPHHISMQHVTVTVDDPVAPTVTVTGGSLTAAGVRSGTQSVTFNASDNAGIAESTLLVDGIDVASQVHPCDETHARPCLDQSGATLSFDSSIVNDGAHSFQIEVEDAAGNLTRSTPRSFQTDNPGPQLTVTGELTTADGEEAAEPEYPAHITATDAGSGVQRVRVLVDGVAQLDQTWTCPGGGCGREVDYVFKTDRYADGPHTIVIEASDYQGNTRRRTITVRNVQFAICMSQPGNSAAWCGLMDREDPAASTPDPADPPFDDVPIDFQDCYDAYPGQPVYCTPDPLDDDDDEGGEAGARATTLRTRRYGIADENFQSYQHPDFARLKVKRIRRILPYNVMDLRNIPRQPWMSDGDFAYLRQTYSEFVQLYDWAATRSPRVEIFVSFEHRRDLQPPADKNDQNNANWVYRPSRGEYVRLLQRFRNRFPRIHLMSPWNEPNNSTQPTRFGRSTRIGYGPGRFAVYANAMHDRVCKRSSDPARDCRMVVGELVDAGNWQRYFREFRERLDFAPTYWGHHPYVDVYKNEKLRGKRIKNSGSFWLANELDGKRLWFTEVGSRIDRAADASKPLDERLRTQRIETRFLVRRLAQRTGDGVNRLYYYQLCEPAFDVQGEDPRWDSGLFNRGFGCGARRPAFYAYRSITAVKNPFG